MDNHTATELAYKNGYEQGKKDAVRHGRWDSKYDEHDGFYHHFCTECKDLAVFPMMSKTIMTKAWTANGICLEKT